MIFRKHKNIARLLAFVAAVLASPVVASAQGIEPKNLGATLRTFSYIIPRVQLVDTTEVTPNTGGVVARIRLFSLGVAQATITQTATIAALPYPARLTVKGIDGGAASGALTCGALEVRGHNPFGEYITETISSLTETEKLSDKVYEDVTYLKATTCAIASSGDTSDYMRVAVSSYLGMPVKLRHAHDLVSMCFFNQDASDVAICQNGSGTVTGDEVSVDEAGAIDLVRGTVNVLDGDLDAVIATIQDRDTIVFRLRPVFSKPMR